MLLKSFPGSRQYGFIRKISPSVQRIRQPLCIIIVPINDSKHRFQRKASFPDSFLPLSNTDTDILAVFCKMSTSILYMFLRENAGSRREAAKNHEKKFFRAADLSYLQKMW